MRNANPLRLGYLILAGALVAATPGLGAQEGAPQVRAAGSRSLFGEVIHDQTAAPLSGATVVLAIDGAGILARDAAASPFVAQTRTAATDEAGQYRFDGVQPGSYVLRVHRMGFRPASVGVMLRGGDSRLSVGLAIVPVRLQPVEVSTEMPQPYAPRARTADAEGGARVAAIRQRQRRYLATDVREVTHSDVAEGVTLAETDLFRALQRLPGVSAPNNYSAELWTRGARWDRTRVMFDGIPLFNPTIGAGIFAAVNADAVGAAFLHPGVTPSAIGEGGAGVLDLRSRTGGGAGELRGVGELSLVSARAALDQRVAAGRGAWMLAARRSYFELLQPGARAEAPGSEYPYHFTELTGRLDWELGGARTLEVSALHSQDVVAGDLPGAPPGSLGHWGNDVARVTLETPLDAGPFGATVGRHTVGVSRYDSQESVNQQGTAIAGGSHGAGPLSSAAVTYVTFGSELAPAREPYTSWSGGYELVHQRADVDGPMRAFYLGDKLDATRTTHSASITTLALWGERRLQRGSQLTVAPGLRVEIGSALRGTGPVRVAPRLSARYAPGDSAVLFSAALGRSYQYTQALAGGGTTDASVSAVAPTWLMADRETPPLRTDLLTAGAERWLGERWHASLNAYVRRSGGVLVPDPTPGPITGQALFVEGQESAHGAEAALRRIQGRWTVAMGYAYGVSHTEAAGLRYASREDRRRVLNVTTMSRISSGLRIGAAYTAASGSPYTRYVAGAARVNADGVTQSWAPAPTTEAPNAARLSDYAALDLLLDWSRVLRRARIGFYLQVHNVLDRKNPAAYQGPSYCAEPDVQAGACTRRDTFDSGLSMLPTLGLRLAF